MLCFVLINSVLMNLSCVWIFYVSPFSSPLIALLLSLSLLLERRFPRRCSHTALSNSRALSQIQSCSSSRSAAQKSSRRRPQIVGRLPFGGDPAQLPSHFGGVELCLLCSDYMQLAIAPGPTVHWLFRSHDLPSKYRSILCSSVPHVLHI